MFGPYWISAATANLPASAVSKSRTDFGMEASSRSTHFCRAVNTSGKTPHLPLQAAAPAPARVYKRSPRRFTALRRLFSLLRARRERTQSRPELGELNDHILKDIGLFREALLFKATWTFRR
jgi:uncharacterized protein YjiS (DUF1127 family)